MADRLHLSPKHRRVLEALLREHLPDVEVWAYGSRVNGRSHDGSDLDLVLRGPGLEKIAASQLADFETVVRESTIPFLVEARDWARLPQRFHREIEVSHVVLSTGNGESNVWPQRLPSELTENFDAVRVPVKEADRRSGPYPYYGASGVVDHVDQYLFDGEYLLVAEDGENLRTRKTPISFLARGRFWVNNHAHILRGNENADTRYLLYALSVLDIGGYLTGSTMPKLTQRNLSRVAVPTPPSRQQRAIAHILGTLDDKIELNRRMNETLEAMARALFKSWFVDFDPVRAKMEGRDTGLPRHIAGLFPDALDDEEKPEGWTIGILTDIADSPKRGISPADVAKDTPYIGLEHMPRHSIALTEWEGAEKVTSNKSIFKKSDFLFGKLRSYFHKVGFAPLDGICSTDIVVITPRVLDWAAFTLVCLSSDKFVSYADQTSTGTKMPRTSWKTMRQYRLLLPSEHIARSFQGLAQPLLDRISANIHEARSLARVRDVLLPKLISGELRVKPAERFIERTL